MSQLRAAMWVHGTIVQVEFPKRLSSADSDAEKSGFRRGWGTLFRGGDPAKAVTDPHAAVAVDVATRKRDPCPACELAGVWTRL